MMRMVLVILDQGAWLKGNGHEHADQRTSQVRVVAYIAGALNGCHRSRSRCIEQTKQPARHGDKE